MTVLSLIWANDSQMSHLCFFWVTVVSACDLLSELCTQLSFSDIVLEHECHLSVQLSHLDSILAMKFVSVSTNIPGLIVTLPSIAPVLVQVPRKKILENRAKKITWAGVSGA